MAQWDESTCNAGGASSVSGSGRSPGGGNGTPLQCSCLKNPMDREPWWATDPGVAKSWTRRLNTALGSLDLGHLPLSVSTPFLSFSSAPSLLPFLYYLLINLHRSGAFLVKSILAKRGMPTHRRILRYHIWTLKQANQND